ncbi:MAG: hypothetical protein BGO69_05795 [Bacteroidetes bacterium 46-16]|nr:MAG: hypothetical protein BGO69_05795 [Bacteroidetes bacterium 46-16]
MKKKIYYSLLALGSMLCCSNLSTAQTITGHSVVYPNQCGGVTMHITTTYTASQQIETSWGDMATTTVNVYDTLGNGDAYAYHSYVYPGTYTIKHVLIQNSQRIDSVTYSYDDPHCQTAGFYNYYDANNNCVYDSAVDTYSPVASTFAIDSAGVPIDTITVTSGFYYYMYGPTGTVYKFTPINVPPGALVSCPAIGYTTVTVQAPQNVYTEEYFGYTCSGITSFDLAANVTVSTGRHHAKASVLVTNNYCNGQNATLTMHFSPKYDFQYAMPAPTTVNGNTLTWDITNLSLLTPGYITADFEVPNSQNQANWLLPGDTVHSSYYLTPTANDTDTVNNVVIHEDTVISSYDPNYKEVSPEGDIAPGTELTYTLHFENTGNDTATNIYILDTLSDNLVASTLDIVASSATMIFSMNKTLSGLNVAKFDFPNINLPDSANNKPCTGMVVFKIKTRASLPPGTYVPNSAGIYFDDNEAVQTNTAVNMIAIPQSVNILSNNADLIVYPNPTNDVLTIKMNAQAYSTLEIKNTHGQVILQQTLKQNDTKVNVKALPSGIYFATLKGDAGSKTIKFEKL